MATTCSSCECAISTRKPGIFCDGVCKKQFHVACAGVPTDFQQQKNKTHGLSWTCTECLKSCIYIDQDNLQQIIANKANDVLQNILSSFETFKSELVKLVIDKISFPEASSRAPLQYSDILKNNTNPAVIVVPKDQN